jgi:hypothetical protein
MGYPATNQDSHKPLEEHDAQIQHPLSAPAQPLGAIRCEDGTLTGTLSARFFRADLAVWMRLR